MGDTSKTLRERLYHKGVSKGRDTVYYEQDTMNYTICRLSGVMDKEQLLKFWNENHGGDLDEKYKWIYENNPAGKAVVSLIRDNETNECTGCFAAFPRRISVGGVGLRAGVAGDLFVHKKHRILIPALKLEKSLMSIVQKKEFDLIYGFPNKKAEPVMKRAGFKYLGSYIGIAKIIKTSEQLQKLHVPKYLNRLLSPLLDVALRLFAFETWYRLRSGFICEEIRHFDERFDELWLKSKLRFHAVGERTSQFLTWRFLRKPNAEYKIFAIFNSSTTELQGYIIHCTDKNSIHVTDFILPEDKKAIRVLVAHFLRYARKASPKSVVIRFLGNKEISTLFRRFGFVRRKSGDQSVHYYCNEHVLKRFPVLEDSESWLLSNADIDDGLLRVMRG